MTGEQKINPKSAAKAVAQAKSSSLGALLQLEKAINIRIAAIEKSAGPQFTDQQANELVDYQDVLIEIDTAVQRYRLLTNVDINSSASVGQWIQKINSANERLATALERVNKAVGMVEVIGKIAATLGKALDTLIAIRNLIPV